MAAEQRDESPGEPQPGFDPADLRGALAATLAEIEADDVDAPRLAASGLHFCLALDELSERLEIGPAEGGGYGIEWRFLGSGEPPRPGALELAMRAEVAHRWLLGLENLPVAIARGRASVAGGVAPALATLPAIRLIAERYRRLIAASFPSLSTGLGSETS